MDLFGKKSAKEKENILQKVSAELKTRGLSDDEIKSFMGKISNEGTAEKPAENEKATGSQKTEEGAVGAKPETPEAGKDIPSDKKETALGQGEGENPKAETQPVAPKGEEGGEPKPQGNQPDLQAKYEELRKTNEALAARMSQVEEALAKNAVLEAPTAPEAKEFGGQRKVATGQDNPENDMGAILKEMNTPRH